MPRSERPLPLLVFTTVFPNAAQPHHGIFVRQRMEGLPADFAPQVVAPRPWFPLVSRLKPAARPPMPAREVQEGVLVAHPRFLSLPLVGKCLDGLLLALGALPALLGLRRSFPFRAIDAHFAYPDGMAAVLLGRLLGVPVVLTLRGTELLLAGKRLRRTQMAFALRRAARVIAVSPELAELAAELGVPRERLSVITNGIDPGQFHPIDRSAARRALGLPPAAGPVLVTVGSLGERKGIHLVLEAMAALVGRFPEMRYLVVGGEGPEGTMGRELKRRAEELGVAGRVVFAGRRERHELATWYGAADLFVLPSSLEGCPNAVLEALACGTPVVATAVGTIPALLGVTPEASARPARPRDAGPAAPAGASDGYPGGLLIPRRDAAAVAAAIEEALARPWDRERVRRRVESRTWPAVGAEVAEVIRAALASHSSPPAARARVEALP